MGKNEIGILGLGVMGQNIAINFLNHGYPISVYNRNAQVSEQFSNQYPKAAAYKTIEEFVLSLEKPRKILLMIQSGEAVDQILDSLLSVLDEKDIVMDGGNSYYKDTQRRYQMLKGHKIHYLGIGISGGAKGARLGPSIMPSGDFEVYKQVEPYLKKIAAKIDNDVCVRYIGQDGAGHFVKMVHNGIEYAIMQLISEWYQLFLSQNMTYEQIHLKFNEMNQGINQSYLLEITSDIFTKKQNETYILDQIIDRAEQKGTGKWTSLEALSLGVAIPSIQEAVNARLISMNKEKREKYAFLKSNRKGKISFDQATYLYTLATVSIYLQGFDLLSKASLQNDWHINFEDIVTIWQEGCIIKSHLLKEFKKSFENSQDLLQSSWIQELISTQIPHYRKLLSEVILQGIYTPLMQSSLQYLEAITTQQTGANLIQAQRDYFGHHGFEKINENGVHHYEWEPIN